MWKRKNKRLNFNKRPESDRESTPNRMQLQSMGALLIEVPST